MVVGVCAVPVFCGRRSLHPRNSRCTPTNANASRTPKTHATYMNTQRRPHTTHAHTHTLTPTNLPKHTLCAHSYTPVPTTAHAHQKESHNAGGKQQDSRQRSERDILQHAHAHAHPPTHTQPLTHSPRPYPYTQAHLLTTAHQKKTQRRRSAAKYPPTERTGHSRHTCGPRSARRGRAHLSLGGSGRACWEHVRREASMNVL